eukprot:9511681-Lingulodinium_polyedra.AAC.1
MARPVVPPAGRGRAAPKAKATTHAMLQTISGAMEAQTQLLQRLFEQGAAATRGPVLLGGQQRPDLQRLHEELEDAPELGPPAAPSATG